MHDGNANENVLNMKYSRYLKYLVIIPGRSTYTMRAKYTGTSLVATAFKVRKRKKNSPSYAPSSVLLKTLILVHVSSRCLAEDVKETCTSRATLSLGRAIVFLIKHLFFDVLVAVAVVFS